MKVLQLIPSLASGGAERLVLDLCNEMADEGIDVYLCTIQNPKLYDYGFYKSELNKNVKFSTLNQTKGFKFSNLFKLIREIQRIKPDIIHGHLSIVLYFYFLIPLFLNIPFFRTIHTLAEKDCPNRWFKKINKIYYRLGLLKVITISDECNRSYERFYKLFNAHLILNGTRKSLKTDQFDKTVKEIEGLKFQQSDTVFVHIARYHILKNQKLLIDVFNRLQTENIGCILLIIGDWSFCDEARELSATAKSNIHFLGTKNNVVDYLMSSDAFCLTSEYEGLPISLLEAISCGCVPICTSVGGIKDIVKDGVSGFLSDEISLSSYYSTIRRFIDNKDKINKELLINIFNDHYLISHTAHNHIKLYQSYIEK